MNGFRWEIEASAGPAREGTAGGCAKLLVRVRLFNEPDETGHKDKPDAFTDLRTGDARHLAFPATRRTRRRGREALRREQSAALIQHRGVMAVGVRVNTADDKRVLLFHALHAVLSVHNGGPVGKGGQNSDEALVASRFLSGHAARPDHPTNE